MRSITFARIGVLACALVGAAASAQQFLDDSAVPPAVAHKQLQEIRHGDPARWHKPANTPAKKLANVQKEIEAAFRESKRACKDEPKDQRSSCLADVRSIYQHDMSNARELATAPPPQLGSSERGSQTQSGQ